MHTMFFLIAATFVGATTAVSFPMVFPVPCGKCQADDDYCSEYEVLHTTPPCCEATCEADCSRVVCPKMLVYEPTCVCLDGFVRHDGQCIPKTSCPALKPPPCETTTPATPCETTTATVPCETTTTPFVTTTPPCPTTTSTRCPPTTPTPPCATSPMPCSTKPSPMYTLKPCGYTPPPCTKPSYVPAPPPPAYQTIPPYRYTARPVPKPCPLTAASPQTKAPAGCVTTPKPCPTTTTPCPTITTTVCPTTTTTTECPTTTTTTTPCPTSPPTTCAACEQMVFARPCCEPSCDYDCSGAACPLILVEEPSCACRPGLVRYQGHCIEPSACPRSASRYRLYVPVEAQCLHCNNEVLNVA